MRKSVENLATSKITGGRRHPARIRRKYEIDRYPNEPVTGAQVTITRRVRGNNKKSALKTIDFVNLATGDSKVKKIKILFSISHKRLQNHLKEFSPNFQQNRASFNVIQKATTEPQG